MRSTKTHGRIGGARSPAWERILLLACGVAFDAAFVMFYASALTPRHNYLGLTVRAVSSTWWVAAWVLSLAPLLWLPVRFRRPSDFAVWGLYLAAVAPAPLVGLMVSTRAPAQVLLYQAMTVLSFGLIELRRARWVAGPVPGLGPSRLTTAAVPILIAFLAFALLARNGFHINLSFADVYTRRLDARELVRSGTFQAYAAALMTKALIPLAIAMGIHCKQRLHLGAGILGSIAAFSIFGTKNAMLHPLLLSGVIWLASRRRARHGVLLLLCGQAMVACAWLETRLQGTCVLNDFAVRRILATPSQLSTYYWEYYSEHPHVRLRDSRVGSLLGEDREFSPSMVIGLEYFGSGQMNANAGIWATAFAHFGYTAMPVVSLLAAWVLRVVDWAAPSRGHVIGCGVAFMIAAAWLEKAFHTSLLSGGVAMLVLLFILLPRIGLPEREQRGRRREASPPMDVASAFPWAGRGGRPAHMTIGGISRIRRGWSRGR